MLFFKGQINGEYVFDVFRTGGLFGEGSLSSPELAHLKNLPSVAPKFIAASQSYPTDPFPASYTMPESVVLDRIEVIPVCPKEYWDDYLQNPGVDTLLIAVVEQMVGERILAYYRPILAPPSSIAASAPTAGTSWPSESLYILPPTEGMAEGYLQIWQYRGGQGFVGYLPLLSLATSLPGPRPEDLFYPGDQDTRTVLNGSGHIDYPDLSRSTARYSLEFCLPPELFSGYPSTSFVISWQDAYYNSTLNSWSYTPFDGSWRDGKGGISQCRWFLLDTTLTTADIAPNAWGLFIVRSSDGWHSSFFGTSYISEGVFGYGYRGSTSSPLFLVPTDDYGAKVPLAPGVIPGLMALSMVGIDIAGLRRVFGF